MSAYTQLQDGEIDLARLRVVEENSERGKILFHL